MASSTGDESGVLKLDNFTPGIYSQGAYASSLPPAPLGAAQETNTYRCKALPAGGLAPMPKIVNGLSLTFPTAGSVATVVGLGAFTVGRQSTTVRSDAVVVALDVNSTPFRRQYFQTTFWGYDGTPGAPYTFTGYATSVYGPDGTSSSVVPTRPVTAGQWWVDQTDSSGTVSVSTPTGVSMERSALAMNTTVQSAVFIFANPVLVVASNGDDTIQKLGFTARLATIHQNRITYGLPGGFGYGTFGPSAGGGGVNSYAMPAGGIQASEPGLSDYTGVWKTNAAAFYVAFGDRFQAYGCLGSVSVGELVAISITPGDSIQVLGDLANPTITPLRGVQPTGQCYMRGISTPKGMIYCSEANGAWIWNGGNGSTKISNQLRDDFYERITNTTGNPIVSNTNLVEFRGGISLQPALFNNLVVFPNNFTFNLDDGSWWRLEDTSVFNGQIWSASGTRYLFAGPDSVTAATVTAAIKVFDWKSPATNFSWQSHPIQIHDDRMTEVFEVEVVALGSGVAGQTVAITLTSSDGSTVTETFTLSSSATTRQRLRKTTFARGWDVVVRIVSDGNGSPAPIIHAVNLKHRPSTMIGAA